MRSLLIVALLGASPALAGAPVDLWVRATGTDRDARLRVTTIDLDKVPLKEVERDDLQYGGTRTFRAIAVDELVRRYAPQGGGDVALLHFANGMAIPLPLKDAAAMKRIDPVIARAIKIDGKWTTSFPPVRRKDDLYFDARPIEFEGNKLVVAGRWHPALRTGTEDKFTPWQHANALTGIELVDDGAYLAQFDVDPGDKAGLEVYSHVCRFCHGARGVGAQFGWDFVEPLPISEYRKKDVSLYYHVKYRASNAVGRGLLMPALPFLTEKDAADVLVWLRALTANPLKPYKR